MADFATVLEPDDNPFRKGNAYGNGGWFVRDLRQDPFKIHLFADDALAADFIMEHHLTEENSSNVGSFDSVDGYAVLHGIGETPFGSVVGELVVEEDAYGLMTFEDDYVAKPILVTKGFIWYLYSEDSLVMFARDESGAPTRLVSDNYFAFDGSISELEDIWYGRTELVYMDEEVMGTLAHLAEDYGWDEPDMPAGNPPSKEEADKGTHELLDFVYGSDFVNELIDSEKNRLGEMVESNKVCTAAIKPQEERMVKEMTEKNAAQEAQQSNYAMVKMPAAFVKPYEFTAKDGRTFDKAYVDFPEGTKVNGIDVGGFSCDVFMSNYMKQQMLKGEQVTISFETGTYEKDDAYHKAGDEKLVTIWTGSKNNKEYPYQKFEVKPWDLCRGIKAANEQYKSDKAAERAATKEPAADLAQEASAGSKASKALAGDEPEKGAHAKANEQYKSDKAAERAATKEPAADLAQEASAGSKASKALAGDEPEKGAHAKANEQAK